MQLFFPASGRVKYLSPAELAFLKEQERLLARVWCMFLYSLFQLNQSPRQATTSRDASSTAAATTAISTPTKPTSTWKPAHTHTAAAAGPVAGNTWTGPSATQRAQAGPAPPPADLDSEDDTEFGFGDD